MTFDMSLASSELLQITDHIKGFGLAEKKDSHSGTSDAKFDAAQATRYSSNAGAAYFHVQTDRINNPDFALCLCNDSEMHRAVEYLEQELASMRTGRASPGDSLAMQSAWNVAAVLRVRIAPDASYKFSCKVLQACWTA